MVTLNDKILLRKPDGRDLEDLYYIYRTYGFETEGVLRQAQYKNGRYHDVILMAKFNHLCIYTEQAVTPK